MGYISGSSSHIKSRAVSALSVLIYRDANICTSVPDLLPSVLALLPGKAAEVVRFKQAVLGFMKVVVVSCLQPQDLQSVPSDILNDVLPWSSASRNHFRSRVRVIVEIAARKCGSAAVKLLTPEKYWGFIKAVLENRHSKGNSKEADDIPDMKENSYSRGSEKSREEQKKGHKESGVSPRRERGMEMETKVDGGARKRVKKGRHSKFLNHERQAEGQESASVTKSMRLRREAASSRGDGKEKKQKKMVMQKQKKSSCELKSSV